MTNDIAAKLAAPFAPEKISWRVGSTTQDKTKGMALAYIDARDVMERLDSVMGTAWQCEYVPMSNGTYCCRLGLKIDDEWIWRSNGSINISDTEKSDAKEMAEKGGYSDAFKRAAVLFGIGRYLYAIDSPWVALEPAGRSYKIAPGEYKRLEAILRGKAPPPSKEPDFNATAFLAVFEPTLKACKSRSEAKTLFIENKGDLTNLKALVPDIHALLQDIARGLPADA